MADLDWAKLQQLATEAGFSTVDLEPGPYVARIAATNYKDSGKTARFGVRWVVVGGPSNGVTHWDNINVPDGSGEKGPQIAYYFLEKMKKLGVPIGAPPAEAIKAAEGKVFNITITRGKPKNTGGFWMQTDIGDEVKDAPAPAATPAPAPAPAAAPAEAAQPTPEQIAAFLAAQQQTAPAAEAPAWQGQRAI